MFEERPGTYRLGPGDIPRSDERRSPEDAPASSAPRWPDEVQREAVAPSAVLRPPPPPEPPPPPPPRRRRGGVVLSLVALIALVGLVAVGLFVDADQSNTVEPGLRPLPAEESEAASGLDAQAVADADESAPNEGARFQDPPAQAADAGTGSEREADAATNSESAESGGLTAIPPLIGEPIVAVAEIVSPSVVRIEVGVEDDGDSGLGGGGLGSGIVWDAVNGYIITNQHVVDSADEVTVTFNDGVRLPAEVLGGSADHDVAVVKVDPGITELVAASFAPDSSVRVGQQAVAIGSPYGLRNTVTAGIVSAVRVQQSGLRFSVPTEMIQTDAAINQGNSGGPLVDLQGRVIGMNTSIRTTSGGSVGLGFAVPSDTVQLIAQRVVDGESLELGYLGISSSREPTASGGVLIAEVVAGSPADEAGLEPGDVIITLDGEFMEVIDELSAAIKLRRPGDAVELEIERDGDRYIATVVLAPFDE